MRFHLPKPLRGWREFLGEVGIIVLGVLIALAAGQFVDDWHWQDEVATERKSLLQEAEDSIDGVVIRQREQSCVDRRLNDILEVLRRHAAGKPLGIVAQVGLPAKVSATRGTWQIALAGQALAHMDHDEKLRFSSVFGGLDGWDQASANEFDTWYRLAQLNHAELMAEPDWADVRSAYARASIINEHIRLLAPFEIGSARNDLGLGQSKAAMIPGFEGFAGLICKPLLSAAR